MISQSILVPLYNPFNFLDKSGQAAALTVHLVAGVNEKVSEEHVRAYSVDLSSFLVQDPFYYQKLGFSVEDCSQFDIISCGELFLQD